jgi:hypothetical protein
MSLDLTIVQKSAAGELWDDAIYHQLAARRDRLGKRAWHRFYRQQGAQDRKDHV